MTMKKFDMSVNHYVIWIVTLSFLSLTLLIVSSNFVFAQLAGNLTSKPTTQEWVKIDNPTDGKQVPIDTKLLISGGSSDNASTNCGVSVIVNNVKPYQSASAAGSGGPSDYSQWKYTLSSNYTQIKEGPNRITAKVSCTPLATKWYSVNVIGSPLGQSKENISLPTKAPSVLNPTNTSAAQNTTSEQQLIPPQSTQQPLLPPLSSPTSGNITETLQGKNKAMDVAIQIANNPVPRGGDQNITISVLDTSSKRGIPAAEITGKLLYPGGNYEKDFSGTADTNGHFVKSWVIGKKGDVGALTIEVQASAPGYESKSTTGQFQISTG